MKHRIVVPSRTAHGATAPLLVALHGCQQTAEDFAAGSRFDEVGAAYGAITLYPQQTKASNSSGCWNWFLPENQRRDGPEPAAILRLVDAVAREHRVDRSRIYVAGLSAGGAMAAILGEQAPDVFSGVGIMAGVALHASHDLPSAFAAMADSRTAAHLPSAGMDGMPKLAMPKIGDVGSPRLHPLVKRLAKGLSPVMSGVARPTTAAPHGVPRHSQASGVNDHVITPPPESFSRMRTMIWTGSDDHTVAPRNAALLAEQYGRLMGIDPGNSASYRENGTADVLRYRDAAGRIRIEVWTVHGMGHAWSGGSALGSFTYPAGPDATTAMFRFFMAA